MESPRERYLEDVLLPREDVGPGRELDREFGAGAAQRIDDGLREQIEHHIENIHSTPGTILGRPRRDAIYTDLKHLFETASAHALLFPDSFDDEAKQRLKKESRSLDHYLFEHNMAIDCAHRLLFGRKIYKARWAREARDVVKNRIRREVEEVRAHSSDDPGKAAEAAALFRFFTEEKFWSDEENNDLLSALNIRIRQAVADSQYARAGKLLADRRILQAKSITFLPEQGVEIIDPEKPFEVKKESLPETRHF